MKVKRFFELALVLTLASALGGVVSASPQLNTIELLSTSTVAPTTPDTQVAEEAIAGITGTARAYTLEDLTNHVWYTVTLSAMAGGTPFLTATIQAMPMGRFVYLSSILKTP